VSERAKGNPDISFSFSRFCSLIRNNDRSTNAAGISASPSEGAFGVVDGGGACECASRISARHGADAQGGGQWKPGRMITRLMTSESSSKKPVISARYQQTLPILLLPELAISGSQGRVGGRSDWRGESGRSAAARWLFEYPLRHLGDERWNMSPNLKDLMTAVRLVRLVHRTEFLHQLPQCPRAARYLC
jgi:hypothetical protein